MIENCAKAAYENADTICAKRVPWDCLSKYWKDYWINVAKTVIDHQTQLTNRE